MIITKESKKIIIEFDREDNQDFIGIVNCRIQELIHIGRLYGNQDALSTKNEIDWDNLKCTKCGQTGRWFSKKKNPYCNACGSFLNEEAPKEDKA